MTDIVERLRGKPVRHDYLPEADRQEAAAEIERLRSTTEISPVHVQGLHNEIAKWREECERLREERMRWRSDNEKLSADNDRLRALLQEAIRLTMSAEHNKISPPKWVIEARRALEREP